MLRAAARRLAARLPLGGALSEAAPLAGLSLAGGASLHWQLDTLGSGSTSISRTASSFSSRSFGGSSSGGCSSAQSGSGPSSGSSGRSGDGLAPPTPEQEAAADRLLAASRKASQHRSRTYSTDAELRQRILLLQLGFSEAAIGQHIMRRSGGPYVAWPTVAKLVTLLRREAFTQPQLDRLLIGGGTTGGSPFSRAPDGVAANLRWLRGTFGLMQEDAALACGREPQLLEYSVEKLQDNWAAIMDRRQLPKTAMGAVATALRGGQAQFLCYDQQTVRDKEAALQALLGLSDAQVSARYGKLAWLLSWDVASLEPRVQLLLELTGLSLTKLAPHVLACTGLLTTSDEALQRNHNAILAAVGDEAAGKLLISRNPVVLAGAVDRVALNLQTLRQPPFGCSPPAAVAVLFKNARLAGFDLEHPAFAARVAFWQQAYACASPEEALLKWAVLLHRDLRAVAPRVAYWRDLRPSCGLPASNSTFTPSDATFCEQQRFQPAGFQAFKQRWLASEEGRAVCRHERGSK